MQHSFSLFLRFALQFPRLVFLSIVLGFSDAIFNGINTTLLVPVLLQFLGQTIELKQAPQILAVLLSPFEKVPEDYKLTVLLVVIVLTILLKSITGYANTLVGVALRRSLMNRIRETAFRILLDVDIDFYNKSQIGDITRKINGEASNATHAIVTSIRSINIIATILMLLAILIGLSWKLTVISTVFVAILISISQLYVRRAKVLGQALTEHNRAYSVHLFEVLSGIRLVRTVASEEREYQKLVKLIHTHAEAELQSQLVAALVAPLNETMSIIILIFIVFLGRILFASTLSSVSTVLLIYLVVLFRLFPFVGQLNGVRTSLANAKASIEVVNDFLRRDNKPFMPKSTIPYPGLNYQIEFDRVSFIYPDHDTLVLKDISLTIPRGKTLALVGGSGSGKSTLADLLARFYDPTAGAIKLDGINLQQFDLASLHQRMGIVSQETFLFNDSVWANIAYAQPDAPASEVIEAAKKANAYEFIENLPQGWETPIGDRGVMLSGGQRQRISIARALLQNPDILILDEATSALDTVSERLVQQALDQLRQDRTTLVIAHRLSTIQGADQIVVLKRGELVEQGTHEELLAQAGEYFKLWQMQFSKNEDELQKTTTLRGEPLAELYEQNSYEIRTHFNTILGSLRLLVDGMIDDPVEQQELVEDAYQSALKLLESMQSAEEKTL
jgi:ABC-type multidrug transport system fused ATPase/permease subunit